MSKTILVTCDCKDSAPIDELKPFQGKLKELSKERFEGLKKSFIEHGIMMPIAVWAHEGTLWIADGHQRLYTLLEMRKQGFQIPAIPIYKIFAETREEMARKLLQFVSQYGKVTSEGLYEFMSEHDIKIEELKELSIPDFNLESFALDYFTDNTVDGQCDEDEVPEPRPEPKVVQGEVYILGNHRLMCGDSTAITDVEKLMNGEKADMVYTDPPYGVKEKTNRKSSGRGAIAENQDFRPIIGDENTESAIGSFNLANTLGCETLIFWGANYYANSIPEVSSWIVWDKRNGVKSDDNADCELAWCNNKKPARIFSHLWKGAIRASEKSEKKVHPTQKPIVLAEWCFENYGNPKTVLDLFGGSGSTLIACEKTNRKCFIMELDQTYCGVILDRWQQFTGKQAYREDGVLWDEIKSS